MIGYTRKVNLDFEEAVKRVKERLSEHGFGVLCEIDVKETLKEKIGEDFVNYIILGACNPKYAHKVLYQNKEFGILMPCNVIVYEGKDGVYISAMKPRGFADQFGNEEIIEIAEKVEESLKEVVDSV